MKRTTSQEQVMADELVPAEIEAACRAVYVQIQSELPLGHALVLGLTSGTRAVGRTTMALGLAQAAARQLGPGGRVLLVDADLEHPTLHEHCGVERSPGLSEVLAGELPVADAVVAVQPSIMFLPAGVSASNLPRLYKELEEAQFLARLGLYFDTVIVDLPPVQTVSIGTLPPRLVPRLCVVARAGATRRDDLQHTVAAFPAEHIAAVLLNEQRQRIPRWLDRLLN